MFPKLKQSVTVKNKYTEMPHVTGRISWQCSRKSRHLCSVVLLPHDLQVERQVARCILFHAEALPESRLDLR